MNGPISRFPEGALALHLKKAILGNNRAILYSVLVYKENEVEPCVVALFKGVGQLPGAVCTICNM